MAQGGLPGLCDQLLITLAVLGFPGESLPQCMPADLVAEGLECPGFAWLPTTLDELHNRHPFAVAEGAKHKP